MDERDKGSGPSTFSLPKPAAAESHAEQAAPRRWGQTDRPAAEPPKEPVPGEVPAQGPTPIRAPMPELPKGGGAIRPIGETFKANPATGTGGMSISIQVSPGRGGFGPELSLTYDSGSGNGPFGLGWQLSIPAITRKTDKRLPEYRDREETDAFLLSGAEELIPALLWNELESTWSRDEPTIEGDKHLRFRPRVEGLFARIERVTEPTGNVYWVATTKDNVKSTYGKSPDARIADPKFPRRIYSWLLEKTEDDRGNVILYTYKEEDKAGVTHAAWEKHRRDGAPDRNFTNRYLKRVQYGNTTPFTATGFLFDLVFDYGEHDDEAPTPTDEGTWLARQDPFSTYRPGFELRTYRLCRRVLVFHRFDELEEQAAPRLVRSTDFTYAESPILTKLTSATSCGYDKTSTSYVKKTFPPTELAYANALIKVRKDGYFDRRSHPPTDRVNTGRSYQWLDLDGEGIPGLLSQQLGALYYKPNRGALDLTARRKLRIMPTAAARQSGAALQLTDITGDGRPDYVQLEGPTPGYYARGPHDDWAPLRAFHQLPHIDWSDENLRFLDLDGDGAPDILITEDRVFRWHPNLRQRGYGPAKRSPKPRDPDGPKLVFADPTQSIYLADMSGDGLTDIVRVRNGNVTYWPNLGYGQFGHKVIMGGPHMDHPDRFDPKRVRLVDLDGSGTADLVYIHRDGLKIWLNQAGNRFADELKLPIYTWSANFDSIDFIDIFGRGTPCIVWDTRHPLGQVSLRYVDFIGDEKPHLLKTVKNNLGLETRIEYQPSTKFYLDDAKALRPWATKLPFPVHVVSRVESYDAVSRLRFASSYTYHHGYYDAEEREFRGFGMVEQRDDERFSAPVGKGLFTDLPDPVNDERPKPPVVTKTWMHTGAFLEHDALEDRYATEYYAGDASALELGATIFSTPSAGASALAPHERREAHRALKGQVLRQEVFAEDESADAEHPYVVTCYRYESRRLQPRVGETAGVFYTFAKETLTHHYERDPADPRLLHAVAVEVDDFGNTLRSASVAYPRRGSPTDPEQADGLASLQASQFVNVTDEAWYRVGVPYASQAYQVHGVTLSADALLSIADLDEAFAFTEEPYEVSAPTGEKKRLLASSRILYKEDDLSGVLALGTIESKALVHQTYALAVTPGMYGSGNVLADATGAMFEEGGHVDLDTDDQYWAPSGTSTLDAATFYQPTAVTDPFGNETTLTWDDYALLVETLTDELGNVVTADNDYRVLAPWQITDPNGNRSQVAFDELGMVVKTAVLGKTTESLGDTLTDPTTTLEYELFRWKDEGKPNFVKTAVRETHGDSETRWLESFTYSDGSGRVVMTKVSAEPGDAPKLDENGDPEYNETTGKLEWEEADPRYVGTGRTVFDNKGNVVRQYEPFFSATSEYEDDEDLVQWGVTPLFDYDPVGRMIRTDFPDGSFATTARTAWKETLHDRNDNVEDSEWHEVRKSTHTPTPSAEDQRAATLTLAHKDTPTESHLDVLGRPFQVDEMLATGAPPTLITTKTQLDIQGNPLAVIDAFGRTAIAYVYGMLGQMLQQTSLDSGSRRMVQAVDGQPVRRWDDRDQTLRYLYDDLRRPSELHLTVGMALEILVEKTEYGEAETDPEDDNLRGKVFRQYDGAGAVTTPSYDFKGNPLQTTRQLAVGFAAQPDWGSATLETEAFDTLFEYDALNRATKVTTPDASETLPTYNEAGLLESVGVKIRGAGSATAFVDDIDYNEKGQRVLCDHGNGTISEYEYDELTFRVKRIKTTRTSDSAVLQNLFYTYDPIGNIVEITDAAHQTVYFDNAVVSPTQKFEYDALYRLTSAEGREHAGQAADDIRDDEDLPIHSLPHANMSGAVRLYEETYEYDVAGNLMKMIHSAGSPGSWTRFYDYAPVDDVPPNNRLRSSSDSGDTLGVVPYAYAYTYDDHGNCTSMPHLATIDYDFKDQMREADKGGGGTVYFTYDAAGQRVRKVWEHSGLREERIYIGGLFEVWRRTIISGESLEEERQTLHVMDGAKRVAMVETLTWEDEDELTSPTPRLRYQLSNHIDTAHTEVDGSGNVFSYEEFHPWGTSAYRSGDATYDVSPRRYRYTGKERDEATGFDCHGLRYRVPWLGRWSTADPMGMVDGPNLYAYARGNPIALSDPSGGESWDIRQTTSGTTTEKGGVVTLPETTFTAARSSRDGFADGPRPIQGIFNPPSTTKADQVPDLGAGRPPNPRDGAGGASALGTGGAFNQPHLGAEGAPGEPVLAPTVRPEPPPQPPALDAADAMAEIHGFGDRVGYEGAMVILEMTVGPALRVVRGLTARLGRWLAGPTDDVARAVPGKAPSHSTASGPRVQAQPAQPTGARSVGAAAGEEAFERIAGTRGLRHSFDSHSAQWYGREVPASTHLGQWQGLVERASRSSIEVSWDLVGEPTIGRLAFIEGKHLFVQFYQRGPRAGELATAFIPDKSQLARILKARK